MARARRRKQARPVRLSQRLVLNAWALGIFGVASTTEFLSLIDDRDAEGVGPDGITRFGELLKARLKIRGRVELASVLETYDENIVNHWRSITAGHGRRGHELKPFQYLALLLTEIYLDRYFEDEAGLLLQLNEFADRWNAERDPGESVSRFAKADLNMLAFWMATGAGKTLLMHVNLKQFLFYLEAAGRLRELNRIILLTPNEASLTSTLRNLIHPAFSPVCFRRTRERYSRVMRSR